MTENGFLDFKKVYDLYFNMWIAYYLIMRSFMIWATVMINNDARKSVLGVSLLVLEYLGIYIGGIRSNGAAWWYVSNVSIIYEVFKPCLQQFYMVLVWFEWY